jgi:predicted transcriptional regulator
MLVTMTIGEVVDILNARVLSGAEMFDEEIHSACGSDLMSDVLAFVKDRAVLLTGMTNAHVVRTAEMLDILCIVFVRGKIPGDDICDMAKERGIAILSTDMTLFTACGLLYEKGLRGGSMRDAT